MRKQGFSIGRGKGSVAIAKDSQNVLDKFYIVSEDAGSLKRWNSAYVALGFKKGELALIFDTAGFDISKDEADAVFQDMDGFFRWKYSAEPTPSALPATLRASFLGPILIFRSAHWGTDAQAVDMFIIEAIGKPEMRRLAVVYYAPPAFTGLQAR